MSIFSILPPHPKAESPVARYRLLSPTASLRVSPVALGGMSFGTNWDHYMGACDQEQTEAILDYYYSQGGNFIDTSGNYQNGQSEKYIGEWMEKRGVRDEMVVSTKFSINVLLGQFDKIIANYGGNGAKSMRLTVNNSLKNLRTDYIDLLFVHFPDFSTSIPDLMHSLNQLVVSGKVLYLGISDTPAWFVSKANEYARGHGLRPFSVYQGKWSAACRDLERDVVPMCQAEGMGIVSWGSLGSGHFKSAEQRAAASREGRATEASELEIKVSEALEAVANRKGTAITSVAQAYIMGKAPYVFPLLGIRKVEHLKGNIEALKVHLDKADVEEIENAAPFDVGFPNNFIFGPKLLDNPADGWLNFMGGDHDHVLPQQAIIPREAR
jgi:aryl-alcohol dehydrogenase-like predicted oxidoreductase